MSRLILTPAILCALAGGVPAAADTPALNDGRRPGSRPSAAVPSRLAPINLIDPVNGTLIDARLTPVLVTGIVDGVPTTIPIAVSSLVSAIALVHANAVDGSLYIRAAQQNQMVVDGALVPATARS